MGKKGLFMSFQLFNAKFLTFEIQKNLYPRKLSFTSNDETRETAKVNSS